jgi:tetratricopeptide (TPR) repeat protein
MLPEPYLRSGNPPMADWAESFVAIEQHVNIRFGRWDDILAEPLPSDRTLYSYTTAILHYAKGVAHAARGEVAQAEAERAAFAAAAPLVPEQRRAFNSTCQQLLPIAEAMLDGEIAYRKGEHDIAFAHLRRAVALDDGLPYSEPWDWMQPPRHALGALLLEQGRIEDAAQVYREDLGLVPALSRASQHPDNVWSLHGYVRCLHALGRAEEHTIFSARLALALARADDGIGASCFCARP